MIRGYLLPLETVNGSEQVVGIDQIHNAVLSTTSDPDVYKLIMDTTTPEHEALSLLAIEVLFTTLEDLASFYARTEPHILSPNELRAQELLETSPAVITMPEMWELLRIYGRRLGYTD